VFHIDANFTIRDTEGDLIIWDLDSRRPLHVVLAHEKKSILNLIVRPHDNKQIATKDAPSSDAQLSQDTVSLQVITSVS
jgi:hypothetical protein